MGFFDVKHVPDNCHVILCVGGGGLLGKRLVSLLPDDVYYINVDKVRMINHERVINIPHDIQGDVYILMEKVRTITSHINSVILAAYDTSFLSEGLTEETKERTVAVDVYGQYSVFLAVYENFWKDSMLKTPSVVLVSTNLLDSQNVPHVYEGYLAAKKELMGKIILHSKEARGAYTFTTIKAGSFFHKRELDSCAQSVVTLLL